jgi:inorganic pyrophosphatase
MTDEEGPDAKILSVPAADPRYQHLQDLGDIPPFDRGAIQHFFMEYKALEPGKHVGSPSWGDRAAARAEIEAARVRAH